MYCIETALPSMGDEADRRIAELMNVFWGTAVNPRTNLPTGTYRNLVLSGEEGLNIISMLPDEIEEQFKGNVTVQCTKSRVLEPHRDHARTVTLLYTVTGVADTVFYEDAQQRSASQKLYSRDSIVEVRRVSMQLGRWYLFDNKSIHSVENIHRCDRTSLVVDLTAHFKSYTEALEYFRNSIGVLNEIRNR